MKKKELKKAVALQYLHDIDDAPKITAQGTGLFAEKLIEIAKKYDIPIKDDPDLVEVLSKLDIYEEIPPDVYLVVAELLVFIYKLNGKKTPV